MLIKIKLLLFDNNSIIFFNIKIGKNIIKLLFYDLYSNNLKK